MSEILEAQVEGVVQKLRRELLEPLKQGQLITVNYANENIAGIVCIYYYNSESDHNVDDMDFLFSTLCPGSGFQYEPIDRETYFSKFVDRQFVYKDRDTEHSLVFYSPVHIELDHQPIILSQFLGLIVEHTLAEVPSDLPSK